MSITLSEEKPEIAKFLSKHQVGVLATADDEGQPHAATIYFVIDEEIDVYFMTKEKTSKYRNLQQNPKVALAVFEPASQSTVQIVGTATEVTDSAQANEVFGRILTITRGTSVSNVPPISKLNAGEYKCFCIKPLTVRLAEYTKPEHGDFSDLFSVGVAPSETL